MNQQRQPLLIGLTGGIGSGKSIATDHFARLGASIIDTDQISHQLTAANGAAMPAIAAQFGRTCVDAQGALDRAAMRAQVFSNPEARQRLEAILHPLIRAEAERQIEQAQKTASCLIVAIPLLLESPHWRERIDRLCVIDCPEALQIERVMARSKLSAQEVRAIIDAQSQRAERLAAADDIIDNSSTLEALYTQIERLYQDYCQG